MEELDDLEKDKIIDNISINIFTKEITILDEHSRKTTIIEGK